MDYTVLEKSPLFTRIPAAELREFLETTPHHIQCYDKGETIFHLMEPATRIGIILEGRVEAQKAFPNGSQVNVSVRKPGEMIGPAAVFSKSRTYPCDIVSLDPVTMMMFRRDDVLLLMQKDLRMLRVRISSLHGLPGHHLHIFFFTIMRGSSVFFQFFTQQLLPMQILPTPAPDLLLSGFPSELPAARWSCHP